MRKVLGSGIYYDQKNNAQVEFFKDYIYSILKKKLSENEYKRVMSFLPQFVVCGPESFACALHIQKWPMDVFTKGAQPGDILFNIFNNPQNEKFFRQECSDISSIGFAYNERPQMYPGVMYLVYGDEKSTIIKYKNDSVKFFLHDNLSCEFNWGIKPEMIVSKIDQNIILLVAGPGHFYLIVGYDTEKNCLISKDPYYGDEKEIPMQGYGFRVEVYPYEK